MTAAVLSIGTELTRGELVNTNAAWLGEELTKLGFDVVEHTTVDDDLDRIVTLTHRFAQTHRVVIVTGGLGPTSDDLTTAAAAKAGGVELRPRRKRRRRDSTEVQGVRAGDAGVECEAGLISPKARRFYRTPWVPRRDFR